MRTPLFSLARAGTVLLCTASAALAQTTVNPSALDQLNPPAPATAPAKPKPPPHPAHPAAPQHGKPAQAQKPAEKTHAGQSAAHPATPAPAVAAAPAAPPPPQVRVPLAAPPPPVLPPALAVPTRPPPAPVPPVVTADAPGTASSITDGVRLTFGEGRFDFNPATEQALRALAHDAPAGATFGVTAFAPGTPEDPSTPRRLALSRALAARSILITEGITSERIFVKALGATAPIADGPPDRVDVTATATNVQARSPE